MDVDIRGYQGDTAWLDHVPTMASPPPPCV